MQAKFKIILTNFICRIWAENRL